jgi:pimeloyl-ACP methyl ester carboxylesterase
VANPTSRPVRSSADLDLIITRMLTPERAARASTVAWERRETLDFRSGQLAYWVAGSGPPVLLVHGWSAAHADLDAFVAPLLERGVSAVALDLPAHGESAGATATLADCGEAIAALGAHLGPLTGVVGHSAGCPSTALALERGLRAERVALIATPQRYERFVRWFAEEEDIEFETLIEAFAARGVDVRAFDLPVTASRLDVPALIVHSVDDRTCEVRGARAVAAAWRGSEMLEVDGLGHSRILRDPSVIARVVDFLV